MSTLIKLKIRRNKNFNLYLDLRLIDIEKKYFSEHKCLSIYAAPAVSVQV